MIIGDCPYEDCDESHMIPCARQCPAFSKETCEKCKRPFWLKHSRMIPEAFTPVQFAERYEVDEAIKNITSKPEKK